MSKKDVETCENSEFGWLFGNIRRKLTLFVVMIMLLVIALFWVYSINMLQPAYHSQIRNDLAQSIGVVVGILDAEQASGRPVLVTDTLLDGQKLTHLSQEVTERLNDALEDGTLSLNGRCLDIAGRDLKNLLLLDNLAPNCLLHLAYESGVNMRGEVEMGSERNGEYITLVRAAVLAEGGYLNTEMNQIVMGSTAAGGQLTVVVAANLERIPQAVNILKRLMLPLCILLLFFSTMAAWLFSRWFTRPLSRLSVAAREMSKGNYAVRVQNCGDDEIGDLARDFNVMAEEVGRSAALQRDILANVSHDLRTPLTLIKGYAETVRDLTGNDAEKRTEQLNVIVDESDRLSGLVGSVLELSRMSSGTEKAEPVQFDLTQLGDEMAYRYEMMTSQNGQTFEFRGEEGCEIYADPKLTERALDNLLGNAIKHIGSDGYIGLWVFKTYRGTVRAEVRDHGKGVAEEDMPYLFDRYYRSRADAGKPGTGLGLSITKAIFEAQGFAYGVDSKPGEGATFWFETKLMQR